jgi:hypothetical protein
MITFITNKEIVFIRFINLNHLREYYLTSIFVASTIITFWELPKNLLKLSSMLERLFSPIGILTLTPHANSKTSLNSASLA